jgi:ElaB/YqjD/DUF883 family membrane-anchored ribosome-binding protein
MEKVIRDEAAFDHEDAPAELRLPPVQRAIRVVRPVGDALARRSRTAADVIGRQGQSLGRFSAAQVKARPFATAAVALAAGAVLGVLLSPRRHDA